MRLVVWSTSARKDLEEIFDFYSLKNLTIATQIHNSILDEADRLADWPEIGQQEAFLDKKKYKYPFRSLVIKRGLFKLIYFITDNYVVISRIWSYRKNPQNLK
ncbi:type II toxin-antitoxin system RelE/ParE family toxin [Parabacteroides sp. PF5-9]|uniref:type II toxin-antitoxin system RelE/ParE family toxin n=1 Tax=Parabacteroides sp. PF5-9 TaxID=1742404 RepID=UPI00247708B6|nr:type II toxin-antitoxin system RelE/ParE family toxin [Parabacteroides sp. PF5-9]MDH6356381.1 plasmid stabilization system protein ParE [Parabacteroides sp. PF5-9]